MGNAKTQVSDDKTRPARRTLRSQLPLSPSLPAEDEVVIRCAAAFATAFATGNASPHFNEIAKSVGCSRNAVKAHLAKAINRGLLNLDTSLPKSRDLSDRLRAKYDLGEAVVTTVPVDEAALRAVLANEAARYFAHVVQALSLTDPTVRVGLDGGQTLFRLAREVGALDVPQCDYELVPLMFGPLKGYTASMVATALAARLEAKGVKAPVRDGFSVEANWHKKRDSGKVHLTVTMPPRSAFDDVQVFFLGIGSKKEGQLSAELAELKGEERIRRRHFGDILNIGFDTDGNEVESISRSRVVPFQLGDLRRLASEESRLVVGVAGGSDKVEAIRVVLRRRYVSVLITDPITASHLLA